jgi:hypothetical protein
MPRRRSVPQKKGGPKSGRLENEKDYENDPPTPAFAKATAGMPTYRYSSPVTALMILKFSTW